MDTQTYITPFMNPREEIYQWGDFFHRAIDAYMDMKNRNEEEAQIMEAMDLATIENLNFDFSMLQKKSQLSTYPNTVYGLKCCLQLSEFELFTLMLCVIKQLDPAFENIAVELSSDAGDKLNLTHSLQVFGNFNQISGYEIEEIFMTERNHKFLFFYSENPRNENLPGYTKELHINPKLVQYFGEEMGLSEALAQNARMEYPEYLIEDARIHGTQFEQLDRLIGIMEDSELEFLVYLKGPEGVGKHHTLKKVASKHDFPVLCYPFLELYLLPTSDFQKKISQIQLEAQLEKAKICVEDICFTEQQLKDRDACSKIRKRLHLMQKAFGSFFATGLSDMITDHTGEVSIYTIEFQESSLLERRLLWDYYLSGYESSEELDAMQLAAKYNYNAGDISKLVRMAYLETLAQGDDEIEEKHILPIVRSLNVNHLGAKAKFIRPVFSFDDIVLEQSEYQNLKDFCTRVKSKYMLMEELGYKKKFPYGQNAVLLLFGPPGTGKTMAAQVVSNELGMDLYKINLSQVFSKYIGETEKQLEEIFEMAKQSNCVLFFDEADALFSKRTEVTDSKDKYSNVETSYLLQKMEEFSGTLILATNRVNNMDDAFKRRMTATVNIQMPGEKQRLELWKKAFTQETQLDASIDFARIAGMVELPPSSIKQAALSACYYAIEEGGRVCHHHIIQGIKQEYAKLGKILYGDIF